MITEEIETLREKLRMQAGEERNGKICQLTEDELSQVSGGAAGSEAE